MFTTKKVYTAWELCADWEWVDAGFMAITAHKGRVEWETATATKGSYGKLVCLCRLDTSNGLRTVARYVKPDTKMRLVKPTMS